MQAGRSGTIGAGCVAFAATVLSLGVLAAPASAAHPLQPDLVTRVLTQDDLVLEQGGTAANPRSILKLENEVGNRGEGPLELRASEASPQCQNNGAPGEVLDADQRIYEDEGDDGFDRETDTDYTDSRIGCLKYHAVHSHWHVLDFSQYTLFSEETGQPVDGTKAGFCLGDSPGTFQGPGVAPDPFYKFNGCGFGGSSPTFMGISVGFADIYTAGTPGQRIVVSGLDRGRYCLRSETDPFDKLTELNNDNNETDLRIHLNLRQGTVRALAGGCQLPI